jgi:hypothetical protein
MHKTEDEKKSWAEFKGDNQKLKKSVAIILG